MWAELPEGAVWGLVILLVLALGFVRLVIAVVAAEATIDRAKALLPPPPGPDVDARNRDEISQDVIREERTDG